MEIRNLLPADRDAATALWANCGLTRSWNDPENDFDRALAGPSSTILGAFGDEVLRGTVMVGHEGHRGWVYYLAVDPTRRDRGVGRALMAAAEDWLVGRHIPKLNLMVRDGNEAVLAFYDRLGYETSPVTVLSRWLQ